VGGLSRGVRLFADFFKRLRRINGVLRSPLNDASRVPARQIRAAWRRRSVDDGWFLAHERLGARFRDDRQSSPGRRKLLHDHNEVFDHDDVLREDNDDISRDHDATSDDDHHAGRRDHDRESHDDHQVPSPDHHSG
jgi:hypothetical protein